MKLIKSKEGTQMKNTSVMRTGVLLLLLFSALSTLTGCNSRVSSGIQDSATEESIFREEGFETGFPLEIESETGESEAGSETAAMGESKEIETESEALEGGETPPEEEPEVQQRMVIATDLHYLAEQYAGNRCKSFINMAETSDGRVLQYSWEVIDAFIEDMLKARPDIILLSGDLTLNGERKSHEELAEKLKVLLEHDIPVIVIPGNHDINNPHSRKFTTEGTEPVESVKAEEFESIYADYGYAAADNRDPNSLSYLYKLDSYYWLLMLDSCQYEPNNEVGGMIKRETYDWIEEQLEAAWDNGAQVITVSHHNLLDQSGVSREFYDDCTIEHNEELIQLLYDWQARLHLSGHLHLQHYKEDKDSGIYEIVTGSLIMAPCQYGELRIMQDGGIRYQAKSVDVDGWAKKRSYRNKDLADFSSYSEDFLRKVTYRNAALDLRQHTLERRIFLSDQKLGEMARFYSELCVYYYGGKMYQIIDKVKKEPAYKYWNSIDYVSELSDFLRNILEDAAHDFTHLELDY